MQLCWAKADKCNVIDRVKIIHPVKHFLAQALVRNFIHGTNKDLLARRQEVQKG